MNSTTQAFSGDLYRETTCPIEDFPFKKMPAKDFYAENVMEKNNLAEIRYF